MPLNRRAKHYYVLTVIVAGAAAALVWLALTRFTALSGAGHLPITSQGADNNQPSPGVSAHRHSPVGIAKASSTFRAGAAHAGVTASPATLSQAQINAVKLPKGFVLAQIPWKRDASHPVPAFVALASLPWLRDVNHPLSAFVALARLPWADCQVTTSSVRPGFCCGLICRVGAVDGVLWAV